jgi:DNA-binding CsgD family transcriptional regulator
MSYQKKPPVELTAREVEVLRLIAESKSTKAIADTLGISFKTAEFHRANVMAKTGARDVAGVTRYAITHGQIVIPGYLVSIGAKNDLMKGTGFLVEVTRDGRQQTVRIEQLNEDERRQLERKNPDDGWRWVWVLVDWIRDNVRESKEGER